MRIVAAAVLVVTIVSCSGGGDTEVESTGSVSASDEHAGDLVYFLPDTLPPGMQIRDARSQVGAPGDMGETTTIVIGRPDGDRHIDVVEVLVMVAAAPREPGSDEVFTEVDVNGTSARLSDDPLVGSTVEWFRDGRSAVVIGAPAAAADLAVDIARLVDPTASGSEVLPVLPDGYERIGVAKGDGVRRASWGLHVSDASVPPQFVEVRGDLVPEGTPPATLLGRSATIERITVRGATAVKGRHSVRYPGATADVVFTTIAWLERPDLAISISGTGSDEAMLAIAEHLQEVDEATFTAEQAPAPPAPQTTSSLP